MRKFLAAILAWIILLSLAIPAAAADNKLSDDIVILYTNDIHTYIDGQLSYDTVSAIKKELKKQYKKVFLVDAGDHIQGTAYGSMDNGKTIIELMNTAGYDLATLGNHEFDYGMEGCHNIIDWADFSYISCNFYHKTDGVRGENVLDTFNAFHCGTEIIAFIGITTPESFTKSTPAYFQDDNGKYIYGISGGNDGAELYADVQKAINAVKRAGATKVIALGHLGDDTSSRPWTSEDVISNVSGLDAFIDGHSHSIVEGKEVTDKDGKAVLLTQAGEYFERIGIMIIRAETGEISTDFIECEEILNVTQRANGEQESRIVGYRLDSELYTGPEWVNNYNLAFQKNRWINQIDRMLGQKIGSTQLSFDNYDEEGNRLVRSQETNTGDFAADALYFLFDDMGMDVDAAIMNGGGIRNSAITGNISYKTCKNIHTFGNVACLQTVTGQQLLDALEWGARAAGTGEECGGFLQVSGITYKIDAEWPASVLQDEKGVWISGPTEGYRVHDVKVYNKETGLYEEIDLAASYNLAGYNYTLRNLGDGFSMFGDAINNLDYVMEDYMVLANYVSAFENGAVDAANSPLAAKYDGFKIDYSSVNGSGRIVMEPAVRVEAVEETTSETETQAPAETAAIPEQTIIQTDSFSISSVVMIAAVSCIALAALAFSFKRKEKN